MVTPVFLQVALNGDSPHPAAPRTPEAIAEVALSVVHAGAHSVHVHAYDSDGKETLHGHECGQVLRAIRRLCPDTPISLTTSAAIVSNPAERLRLIQDWDDLPDLVSANQGEPGIIPLCEHLLGRGVGIEAGLLTESDAEAFVASGLARHCRCILIEPLDLDPQVALQRAAAMERIVTDAGIQLEQLHHGYGMACWDVNRRALQRGHSIRTGLEDVITLPDGSPAANNADLTTAAVELIRNSGSRLR
ncbi:3-keto-5-aminohexanoate cleavage protein [Terriglobus sp. TAA 43]|uniref:3-keto-5-aminohexanoate cleavage protein n=1 Tax=Terriglobus sp. TAA 43 TaxID=278961 RepID=UPI00064821D6|nr:3-keto-5-aminohexanoate cleavage protein [Terriglobus sp. TAA 43]